MFYYFFAGSIAGYVTEKKKKTDFLNIKKRQNKLHVLLSI